MTRYHRNPAAIGRTDWVDGEIEPCRNGLHASPTPSDALKFVCGTVLWEVDLTEVVRHGDPVDKYAGRTRKYLRCARIPMRKYTAQQALGLAHLWACPDIVREYLTDESKGKDRGDIRLAAWIAASDGIWAASLEGVDAVAFNAAWAAENAAWSAASNAARGLASAVENGAYEQSFNALCIEALGGRR